MLRHLHLLCTLLSFAPSLHGHFPSPFCLHGKRTGRHRRRLLLWHLDSYRSEQTPSSGTPALRRRQPFTFWLPALWFVMASANDSALKTLLFSASPWGKLWACCQHMAFLPLGGREGVVFRSRVLAVSFLVLPLSQSNFVSLRLLWSPCESSALAEIVLLPQSSSIHWHKRGSGSSRTLPDGLWESSTPQGYSRAQPVHLMGNTTAWAHAAALGLVGTNPQPLVLLFVNSLCCGTWRRPRAPSGPSVGGSFRSVALCGCSEVTRTQVCFQLCCTGCQHTLQPCQWFPVRGCAAWFNC